MMEKQEDSLNDDTHLILHLKVSQYFCSLYLQTISLIQINNLGTLQNRLSL